MLVVGASATGVQLADEIRRSGRRVVLSVGEHLRLPRMYRGRDVLWWMEASGVWDQRYDEIDDLSRARKLPSPQLVGTPERVTLDINALIAAGVEIVGRLAVVRDGRALFSGGLRNLFALADLKMNRLLDTFDDWARNAASAGSAAKRRDAEAPGARRTPHAPRMPRTPLPPNASSPPARPTGRRSISTCAAARFKPSSGPPDSARTIAGSMSRCSTPKASCATTAA